MNANKAAYWIAVGALALGLNSEYRQGNFASLHRVADRTGSVLCRITTRAEQTLTIAKLRISAEAGLPDSMVASADAAEMAQARAGMQQEQNRSREDAARLQDETRDGLRDRVRDEIRAQTDVIRARAEMRRAEIEMQLRTRSPFTLASASNRNLMVFCPKTGMRIALNHIVAGSRDAVLRETF
jgi:hypothetical protein